jgi:hypothetical protein
MYRVAQGMLNPESGGTVFNLKFNIKITSDNK